MSQMAKPKGSNPKELTGRHVLIMLVAFFAIIIGVNTVFIAKAVNSFSGEDVKGSYRQGLDYNKTIESRAIQAKLGWTVKTNLIQSSETGQRIIVRIFDANTLPVEALSIHGFFKRPTDLAQDQSVVFTERGDGIYEAHMNLSKGQWRLKAFAVAADTKFRFEDHMIVL